MTQRHSGGKRKENPPTPSAGPPEGSVRMALTWAHGGCPAGAWEPLAISPPLCPHSPQWNARQECVHHEAQVAAESTEPQIQVGQSTGLWVMVHRFHFNERKCWASQSLRRELCPLALAVRAGLTGNPWPPVPLRLVSIHPGPVSQLGACLTSCPLPLNSLTKKGGERNPTIWLFLKNIYIY